MSQQPDSTRPERRAVVIAGRRNERRRARSVSYRVAQQRRTILRTAAFVVTAAGVLAVGIYLAAGDLVGQRGAASTANVIPVRMSMAGFTPAVIRVRAGERVAVELWTTDSAPHLEGGIHTMISDELGIRVELPAAGLSGESRRIVELIAPATPGTYDIYCDTCCGGKASPTMHGQLVVEV